MSNVVPIRPRAQTSSRRATQLLEIESESVSRRNLAIHVAVFSGIALTLYSVAVFEASQSLSESLWLVWLIFVIAVSKLLLANGLFAMVIRADSAEVEQETARLRPRRRRSNAPVRRRTNLKLVRTGRDRGQ